jgi:hypothetical protein
VSSSINRRRYETILQECLDCGWGPNDAHQLAAKIIDGRVWGGLASIPEVRLDAIANVGETSLAREPTDFLFCDSGHKSR